MALLALRKSYKLRLGRVMVTDSILCMENVRVGTMKGCLLILQDHNVFGGDRLWGVKCMVSLFELTAMNIHDYSFRDIAVFLIFSMKTKLILRMPYLYLLRLSHQGH